MGQVVLSIVKRNSLLLVAEFTTTCRNSASSEDTLASIGIDISFLKYPNVRY